MKALLENSGSLAWSTIMIILIDKIVGERYMHAELTPGRLEPHSSEGTFCYKQIQQ